jgi:uncharacterized protein (TIGR00251 family)
LVIGYSFILFSPWNFVCLYVKVQFDMTINITKRQDGVTIECYVTPRAGKSRIKGEKNGALSVALAASPVEGRANEELIRFMAEVLSVSPSRISILRGMKGRTKVLFIREINKDETMQRLSIA